MEYHNMFRFSTRARAFIASAIAATVIFSASACSSSSTPPSQATPPPSTPSCQLTPSEQKYNLELNGVNILEQYTVNNDCSQQEEVPVATVTDGSKLDMKSLCEAILETQTVDVDHPIGAGFRIGEECQSVKDDIANANGDSCLNDMWTLVDEAAGTAFGHSITRYEAKTLCGNWHTLSDEDKTPFLS